MHRRGVVLQMANVVLEILSWDTRFVPLLSVDKGPNMKNLRSKQVLESVIQISKWSGSKIRGRLKS